MVDDVVMRNKIHSQLPEFHYGKGLFGLDAAKSNRKTMLPAEWWDFYGDGCPELKKFAIRVLSLTCSSSGCERNWSSFEMVHTKKRNRLLQKKMNDLVYVMYNMKLRTKQIKRNVILPFDDIQSDNEWLTEEVEVEESVQQSLGDENENDSVNQDQVGNVEVIGSSSNPTLDDLENLILDPNVEEPLSSEEEELDDDDDDDDSGDEAGVELEDVGGFEI